MKTRRSMFLVVPAVGLAMWGGMLPSHAITLEQKWQKGAQMTYDFNMQGDATILTDAPQFPMANFPIPLKLKGTGQILLDTKDVDASGTGSVIPTFAPFNITAEAFGQKLEAQLRSDKTQILFGGRPAWAGDALPATTFKISRDGKLLGVVLPDIAPPVAPKPVGGAAKMAPAPAPMPNAQVGIKAPGAPGAAGQGWAAFAPMLQAIITQVFPAVWPGHDVNEGDMWSATVTPPVINMKDGEMPTVTAPAADAKPLGKFDFKLGPEEQIGGRTARRVSMSGMLSYTGDKANAPAADAKPNAAPQGQLQSVSQKVSGNLWFDPTLGQIVRAELDLQSGIKGSAAIAMGPGKGAPSNGSLDFMGTIQIQLKNVVMPTVAGA